MESLAAASQLTAELPALAAELAAIVGDDGVVSRPSELAVYECDGWTIEKSAPDLLVLPRTTAQVSGVLRALDRRGIAFVPRGAGTGLSGGCLPLNAPVMICTSRMNRIVAIDLANRRVEVESGVVNLHVTNAVKAAGLFLCARSVVAGRLHHRRQRRQELRRPAHAEVRRHHQSRARRSSSCCPTARSSSSAGRPRSACGYDLVGAVVGSEGTSGIVTRATLRLMREPRGASHAARRSSPTSNDATARGLRDHRRRHHSRRARDDGSADHPGGRGGVPLRLSRRRRRRADHRARRAGGRARPSAPSASRELPRAAGAREVRLARDEAERALLWKARKRAFGAVGRLAPNYAPRTASCRARGCPTSCASITAISQRYELAIGNVFHAGDGNIHPIVLFDERDARPGAPRDRGRAAKS